MCIISSLSYKKRKQMFRCALKVVVQVTLLTFVNLLFMYDDGNNDRAWVMEVRGQKEIVIIASFDHLAHVTNELDLFLSPRFPCQKDAQKPLLFGTWSREGFSPGGTTSPQLEQPRLKNFCTMLLITNQQQFSENYVFYTLV